QTDRGTQMLDSYSPPPVHPTSILVIGARMCPAPTQLLLCIHWTDFFGLWSGLPVTGKRCTAAALQRRSQCPGRKDLCTLLLLCGQQVVVPVSAHSVSQLKQSGIPRLSSTHLATTRPEASRSCDPLTPFTSAELVLKK
ncbi:hypothetical protein JOQ06_006820, partial [Pogonophryne albipinna]